MAQTIKTVRGHVAGGEHPGTLVIVSSFTATFPRGSCSRRTAIACRSVPDPGTPWPEAPVGRDLELTARDLAHPLAPLPIRLELHPDGVQSLHRAIGPGKPLGGYAEVTRPALFMGRGASEDIGPERPGIIGARSVGGEGKSSSWWTETAPCRCAVPRQSAPCPATDDTTRFPRAEMKRSSGMRSPKQRRFCSGRYSMAKWIPSRSRPGTLRLRGSVAPPASRTASNERRRSLPESPHPRLPACGHNPSAVMSVRRRSRICFSSLNSGIPLAHQAPDAIRPLEDRHPVARAVELLRSARPAGPEPTTPRAFPSEPSGVRASPIPLESRAR